jgi:hypothetical protein
MKLKKSSLPSRPTVYDRLDKLPPEVVANIFLKASLVPQNLVGYDEVTIANATTMENEESLRRAISTVSNLYNIIGMPRTNFSKADNDLLASNAYYALGEKSILDYISTLSWTIQDKQKKDVESEIEWLQYPNTQDSFSDIIKATIPDIMRYDAGVWVKSFNRKGYLVELKSYLGTEFWKEIDRLPMSGSAGPQSPELIGIWSHGYVKRIWQRSRPGVYISFDPNEICYFSMYKRSDTVYGFDFISTLKWQIQYLIDSTRAAGRTFANGVVPSLVWKHPQVHDMTTLQQRLQEVNTQNRGPQKFGSIMHLVRDEEVSTLASTLHDMEWLEGQRFIAQLVWAMWGFQPQEFSGESVNRATAYISRNITKSKILYPMMKYIEDMINYQVLPLREGYKKDWKFSFVKDVDFDDSLKMTAIKYQIAQTAAIYRNEMGLTIESAIKMAGGEDDLDSIDVDKDMLALIKIDKTGGNMGMPGGKLGKPEGYKGTAQNETPMGAKEETQSGGAPSIHKPTSATKVKKAVSNIVLMKDGKGINIIFGSDVGVSTIGRDKEITKIAKAMVKEVQTITGHNRELMNKPEVWQTVVEDAIVKYGFTLAE